MILNLGSGNHYAPGWTNVDLFEEDHPDIVASIYDLPIETGSVERVYVGHLMEHLPWATIPRALAEVRRVCKPRAEIMVVGPDLSKAVLTGQPRWLLDIIVAPEVWDGTGRGHAWTSTELLTMIALADGLLEDIEAVSVESVVPPEWPNPVQAPWQLAVHAWTPAAP